MSRVTKPAAPAAKPAAAACAEVPRADDAGDDAGDDGGTFTHLIRPAERRVKKPTGVASSVFDAAKIAARAKERTPVGRQKVSIDPAAVIIRTDRPIPPRKAPGIDSGVAALLHRMPVGGSFDLTAREAKAVARIARKLGYRTTLRTLDGGGMAMWIVARPGEDVLQRGRS